MLDFLMIIGVSLLTSASLILIAIIWGRMSNLTEAITLPCRSDKDIAYIKPFLDALQVEKDSATPWCWYFRVHSELKFEGFSMNKVYKLWEAFPHNQIVKDIYSEAKVINDVMNGGEAPFHTIEG